jgi:hypothetical protein
MILSVKSDYFLKQRQAVDLVMVKRCVFFAVRTELLNIIWTNFGFKELITKVKRHRIVANE